MLSNEKINRIKSAIRETQKQIDREMRYMEHNRNYANIAMWQEHIKKLESMLSSTEQSR